jgi:hypothetical protein
VNPVPRIVVLNSQAHAKLRIHTGAAASFGDDQRFVPVVIAEFSALALHYPVLLSKDAETGRFYCGAMLGFDAAENLFLPEHQARSVYRPLNLQRGPFYTSGSQLAIDLDHPRVAESGDEPLFGDSGEPTAYLLSIMALMRELQPGTERTRIFVETLVGLKLIEPVSIDARFDDGTRRDVVGLYTINRNSLGELPDDVVLGLFRRGYLQLIYHLLASLTHVSTLAQKKNRLLLPGSDGRTP